MNIHDILYGSRQKSISRIIEEGNLDELEIFFKNGGDVNKNYDDNTLLHDDYLDYNTETFEDFLKVLISLGFNINSKNNEGHTPLYLCKNEYIKNILIKYGGKVTI